MSNHHSEIEARLNLLARELEERKRQGFILVAMEPTAAFALIGLLQLVNRHPRLSEYHRTVIRDLIEPLETAFEGYPVTQSLIAEGWDPSHDLPAGT